MWRPMKSHSRARLGRNADRPTRVDSRHSYPARKQTLRVSARGPGCGKTRNCRFSAQHLATHHSAHGPVRKFNSPRPLSAAWSCVEIFTVRVFTQPRANSAVRTLPDSGHYPALTRDCRPSATTEGRTGGICDVPFPSFAAVAGKSRNVKSRLNICSSTAAAFWPVG